MPSFYQADASICYQKEVVIHIIWIAMHFSLIFANIISIYPICLNLLNTNSTARVCLLYP